MTHEQIVALLIERIKAVVVNDEPTTLLVVGRAGAGKSSTVNSLLGMALAQVSNHDRGTRAVTIYGGEVRNIKFKIVDTPGFGADDDQDRRTVEALRNLGGSYDALLYISALDQARFDIADSRTLRGLLACVPNVVWKNSVIVFTKADLVGPAFIARQQEWITTLRKKLSAMAPAEETSAIESIPSVAIANGHTVTPDNQEWLGELFVTVLKRIDAAGATRFWISQTDRLDHTAREAASGGGTNGEASNPTGSRPKIHLNPGQKERVREVIRDMLIATAASGTAMGAVGMAVAGPAGAAALGALGVIGGLTLSAFAFMRDLFS